jgi:hypothetical protein
VTEEKTTVVREVAGNTVLVKTTISIGPALSADPRQYESVRQSPPPEAPAEPSATQIR